MDNYICIDTNQGSKEWLELRRKKVTASDAPVLMRETPIMWGKSPYSLWLDKLMSREIEMNPAMERGVNLEPFARTAYIEYKNIAVEPDVIINKKHQWAMASLDGINHREKVLVEIKCPGEKTHQMAKNGTIPKYYYGQLQHQLFVTGFDSVDYWSYDGLEGFCVNIKRDDEYIDRMIKLEYEFYQHLINVTEPDDENFGFKIIDSEEAKLLALNFQAARIKAKELKNLMEEHKEKLIELANGENVKIGELRIKQTLRKGNINYKDIPELQDVDLNEYRCEPYRYYTFSS